MAYKRIISLVPSLTELLIDFGLKDYMVGRTRFCIHPEEAIENIPIMGGTKNPRLDKILEAEPDLIIANKEENREEDIQELREETEVHVTDIDSLIGAIEEINKLGNKLGAKSKAEEMITSILGALKNKPDYTPLRTAYFIWKDPWMTIGKDTYIHDILNIYDLQNVYGDQTRYPETSLEELKLKNPELIMLSSEPYPFKQEHLDFFKEHFPQTTVKLVEGEWFSWYGSRIVPSLIRLNEWREKL